jgi:MFS family permease
MGESTPRRPTREPRTNAANYLTPLAADIPFERVETNDSEFCTHTHDSTGKPLPHYEGPYYVEYQEDGTRVEKRWYGRLEDGYLAWSSVFLHEYFGFTIYHPLTPLEQLILKQEFDKQPPWVHDFKALPNLAILLSYFCIGVALQLLRTPLIVYLIADLNATPAQVNVLFTVMAVPWCFKVIYGFLSDCLPINGQRRKPYFIIGWLVFIASNLLLAATPSPSIQLCICLVFAQTAGYMLSDVMTDALIVERSRYETQEERGQMQSQGYIVRFFGSTIGAAIGAVVYNKGDWEWYLPINVVFFINAAFPIFMLLPFVPYLLELDTHCHAKNFQQQCFDLFCTAQLRAVWQPMTFVYIYNALQLTNAAWMNFLVEGLGFMAWQIGIVSIAGSIFSWLGILTYEKFFFAANWRIVYFWCTTLATIIALGQLVLVFGWNRSIGIPDIWFSMGDDVLVEFVIAVQFLPMCIMYLGLCPEGSEGTTYAMLTTFSNLAGSLAFDISTALTAVWDVSSSAIAAGDYSGVWKLSLLCGLIGPLPLVLLGLIPKDKADQQELQQDTKRHYWRGVAFIVVMIVTLAITFTESIYEVYYHDDGDLDDNQRRLKRLMVGH